jgi:D-alanyl-lipoteichoic acid acyltransferase DltB (MBOAT superfamily)
MMNQRSVGQWLGICMATVYATLVVVMVRGLWHGLHVAVTLLLFVGLWIGFYFAGVWASTERRAELDMKFPTSSKELRRRKKEFYDWLASQGRR